jgi:LytS/YehU family sensor histidine kinase
LRAAVPNLSERSSTIAEEMERVRAYLEIMHLRMPDRLQFSINAADETNTQVCPPMSILTLVENAVRHGIDPSEEGGRIDVRVQRFGEWFEVDVSDTGVGLRPQAESTGLGTGVANLRERLRLALGDDASVALLPQFPRGVRAVVRWRASVST